MLGQAQANRDTLKRLYDEARSVFQAESKLASRHLALVKLVGECLKAKIDRDEIGRTLPGPSGPAVRRARVRRREAFQGGDNPKLSVYPRFDAARCFSETLIP